MKRALSTALAVVAAVMVGALAWAALRTGAPNHARPVERHRPLEFTSSVSLSDLQAHMTYSRNLEAIAVGDLAVAVAQAELDAFLASLAPPPPPVERAPVRSSAPVAYASSLYPCGGDLPPCYVAQRESGGDYRVWNGGCYNGPCPGAASWASGKWQFLPSTWAGYGGFTNAADAPPEMQDERARQLWAGGAGCSHWSAC